MTPAQILILAGKRDGDKAVASVGGVSHKALMPVAGMAMLERVIGALRAALPVTPITVAIDATEEISALLARYGVQRLEPGTSPATTVSRALHCCPVPMLVVTADHALLRAPMIEHFLAGVPWGCDGAVALARRETVEAKYQSKRTYWRFADGEVSGCNLFFLGSGAAKAVAFWRQLEADRKKPWRVVRRLGVGMLLRFLTGRLSLSAALARLSVVTGARLSAVDMPFAEAPIDIDKPEDLILAEAILADAVLAAKSGRNAS